MKIKFIDKIINRIRDRRKYNKSIRDEGNNNVIMISEKDRIRTSLRIKGDNNYIKIDKLRDGRDGDLKIFLCGNNCKIIIEENISVNQHLEIRIGQNHQNFGQIQYVNLTIGKNSSFESAKKITFNSGSSITIGEDCMFANNVTIFNTDAHPIFDINNNKIINYVNNLIIGNHCWLGNNSVVLKNSVIPDNCVIGYGSIVSKKFSLINCAIAGNPAKIIKENINWSSNSVEYCKNGF